MSTRSVASFAAEGCGFERALRASRAAATRSFTALTAAPKLFAPRGPWAELFHQLGDFALLAECRERVVGVKRGQNRQPPPRY